MEHYFLLPVTHLDATLELRARLQTFGYTYRYFIMLDNSELVFELNDGESEFKTLVTDDGRGAMDSTQLARNIIVALESLNK